jgi:transcription elongation GreA/GreB family factor
MQVSKVEIHQTILHLLSESIIQATRDYDLAKESRDSDTKSSAGDKFETGREMMQREMDKISASIDQSKNQLNFLSKINLNRPYSIVDLGCLIITDQDIYYISIGLGKVEINAELIYAISLDSPIGQIFKGKRVGDILEFRGKTLTINQLL